MTAKEAPTQGNRVLAATGATPNKDYKNIFTSDNTTYEVQNRNDGTLRLAVNGDSSADSSHVHSWIYAIKEGTTNTIVATCNAAGCPNPNGGSVTITAPEHKTYDDGKSAEAQLTKANWQGKNVDVNSITYGKQDGTPLTVAPTEVGEYKASITVEEQTAFVEYEITDGNAPVKQDQQPLTLTASKDTIAVGDNLLLTATGGSTNGAVTYQFTDGTGKARITDNVLTAEQAGTVTVTATKDGNDQYNDVTSNAITITITEKSGGITPSQPDGGSTGGSSGGGSTTYTITAPGKTDNGSVSTNVKNAKAGDTVTVTATPDKGYTLETLTVLDQNGKEIKLTDKGDGKYTFTMPAGKVEVKASFVEDNTMLNYFVDVKPGDFFYDAVLWAAQKGITTGTDAVHFSPNKPCTRAQIVTFLWRAAGAPEPKSMGSFADVPANSYYAKAVAWAIENGITTGTGDGKFDPDAICTRAQAAAFLYRASGSPAVSGGSAFGDVAANAYYADAVAWAEKNGITEGIGGGLFGTGSDCTRAQIVTFLYRTYQGK